MICFEPQWLNSGPDRGLNLGTELKFLEVYM